MADALAPGLEKENALRDGGFSEDEISTWKGKAADELAQGGFSPQETRDYFGVKDPDTRAMKSFARQGVDKYNSERAARNEGKPPDQHEAHDFMEALQAGWQTSVTGLGIRGKMPDTVLPEHAGMAMRIASQISQLAGDMPAMAAGGFGGAMVGAPVGGAVGTAVLPGVGTLGGIAYGAAAGGSAGAFAAPAAMRKILMDHYEKGDIKDASDFMDRLSSTTWEAIKQGTVGAATGGVGKYVGGVAGPIASLGAELGTMTTMGAAMEGHLPNAQDFIDGAIVLGGVHAATGGLPSKLREIYAKTGEKPQEILEKAQNDVTLKQELLSENPDMPSQAEKKIEVPSQLEQEKLGLKPVDENGKVIEGAPGLSESENKVLSRIGESQETPKKGVRETLNDEYAKTFDYTFALGKALEDAGVKSSNADENAQVLARLNAAHADTVRSFVEFGTRDFKTGEKNGESFQSVMDDYKKQEPTDPARQKLTAYWMSERALEKESQGVKTGVDLEAAKQVVAEGKEKYGPIVQRAVDYENRTLKYAKDAGIFSEEGYQKMLDNNKFQLPFYRVQEVDELTGKKGGMAKTLKKMTGSEAQILDPITSVIKNTDLMIKLAETNRIRKTFVDQISKSEHMEDFLRPLNEDIKWKDDIPEQVKPFMPESKVLNDTQFAVWEDGKRKVYEASPGVVDALRRLDGDQTAMGTWAGLLKGFSAALRIGTVNNPAFAIRHFWRNQITAGVFSQTGLRPFIDAALHAPAYFTKNEDYQNFLYNGGGISEIARINKSYVESKIYDLNAKAPFMDKAWNNVKSAGAFSHWFITTTDNLARFAEYQRSVEKGFSPTQAAFNAREVIPDYQRAGLQRSFLRTTAAFLNVHMQSEDRMIRALKDDPAGTIAKSLAYITLPTVLLAAANRGDDRVDDQPNWLKDLYWTTAIDHWRPGTLAEANSMPDALRRQGKDGAWEVNDGTVIRIPKPFTLGIAFGSAVEAGLKSYDQKNPQAMKDWAKSVASSMVAEPIPNAFGPAIEHLTNYNFFKGSPVVTSSKEKLLPEMQYDTYTSETAKVLGKLISYVPMVRDIGPGTHTLASPMVIENYIHGWSGTLGTYALDVMDKSLAKAGIVNAKVEPLSTLGDDPFIREFVARYPSSKTQSIIDFESRYKKADAIVMSIKALAKQGDFEGAMNLQTRYQGNMDRLKGVDVAMQRLTSGLQKVRQDPGISPTEKRQLMDGMMYQMSSMAKMGNKLMDEFESTPQNKSAGAK